jgi:hypothetical protein
MSEALFWIGLGMAAALTLVPPVLWRARSAHRVSRGLLGFAVALATVWLVNLGLVASDHRNADGWVDCHPSCSTFQSFVGGAFVWGGIALLARPPRSRHFSPRPSWAGPQAALIAQALQ